MSIFYAIVGGGIATIPATIGAVALWHRLVDWHDRHTDRPSGQPIRPTRRPIAAITATPHWPVIDDALGPLRPAAMEPARLYEALVGSLDVERRQAVAA